MFPLKFIELSVFSLLLLLVTYKVYLLTQLKKVNQRKSISFLHIYPAEYIYSTGSWKKRELMIRSNKATWVLYVYVVLMFVAGLQFFIH